MIGNIISIRDANVSPHCDINVHFLLIDINSNQLSIFDKLKVFKYYVMTILRHIKKDIRKFPLFMIK